MLAANTFTLRNGLNIAPIGLGTYSIHDPGLFIEAINAGYQLFDTAAKYGNEKELGLALKSANQRGSIIISKVHDILYLGRKRYFHIDKRSIRKCFKISTQNLGGLKPNIYLLHSMFSGYSEAYKELISLYEANEVQAIGVCNCLDIGKLKNIRQECGQYPMINQIEVHPFFFPKNVIDFCQDNDIQVIARSPLAHGDILYEMNNCLSHLSKLYSREPVQITLRWLIQKHIVPIPRTNNPKHLKQNIAITDFTISHSDMQYIDNLNRNISFGFFTAKV